MTDDVAMTADEVLTTTRAVRRRLDLDRPVDPALVDDCLRVAQQAPSASNLQQYHFVVVTDPDLRRALAGIFRRGLEAYRDLGVSVHRARYRHAEQEDVRNRVVDSVEHLGRILDRVPVHVIPVVRGRVEGQPAVSTVTLLGSVLPATWSFMLAARARGLGTVLTTLHLFHEHEAAELLGIPAEQYTQIGLVPVAHTMGTDFRPAARIPLEEIVHRDRW